LRITQPFEGLHFGVKVDDKVDGKPVYSKNLKNKDGQADGSVNINDKISALITDNILDVAGLADYMKQKLNLKETDNFTSAEFAYQMVDSRVRRTITVTINPR